MQNIQIVTHLVQSVRRGVQPKIRLRLPDNSADILSAMHLRVVLTAQQIARLSACHAANVIPNVRIADLAIVFAALHHPVTKADHAANVRVGQGASLRFLLGNPVFFQNSRRIRIQIRQRLLFFLIFRIHIRRILTFRQKAGVFARNAANGNLAVNLAGNTASPHLAGVLANNAANGILALHCAVKAAL